jgi:arylsulfatase
MNRRVFLALAAAGAAHAQPGKRPNFLIILADDLGYSDLRCYGGEIDTPNLDRLASSGVRWTQFYNTARCCPSRASILTGQYPHRVGLGHMTQDIGQPGYRGKVSDRAATIAEALHPSGYRSFISGKWHLGTTDPTRHGFEEFYGTLASAPTFWDQTRYLRLPQDRTPRTYPENGFYGTDALTDHAIDFLGQARQTPNSPWFLYLAYNSPHFPLHAPKDLVEKYVDRYRKGWDEIRAARLERMKKLGIVDGAARLTPRSRYWNYGETETGENPAWDTIPAARREDLSRRMAIFAAMVDRMDTGIGRVVDDLKAQGELDNTLIVFLSDNGACAEWDPYGFDGRSSNNNVLHEGEDLAKMGGPGTYHSAGSGWANASNTPWRMYKHFSHEGGISTPCIMHWPAGLKQKGAIEKRPAHIIDLMPTFVEAAGAKYPARVGEREILPMAGESVLPLLRGKKTPPRTLYFEHEGHRAVREGRHKLTALRGESWKLYDIDADRAEMNDLSAASPDLVARLSSKWDKWAAENHVTPLPDDYRVPYIPRR